ncbi:hypothetical protein B0A49_04504 [Cryomyces minteri]|uniref:REJ domain-containing protein n=1 Tax=Cryomyces minteri TaxID=331657 RepID=A0A4U0XNU8_9PEZI|nr:hypothetical protein B0A49_04504 [Cryomyces minteri]
MDWPHPLYYTYHHGVDSWVEISSQPSSSSLSSVADEVVTSSLRIQRDPNTRRRRRLRPTAPTHLNITTSRASSTGGGSSQEEYEESESESDRVMTSSGEGLPPSRSYARSPLSMGSAAPSSASDDGVSSAGLASGDEDDEKNTAVNFPISTTTATTTTTTEQCFTPQPNAFSHPPTSHSSHRHASQPVPGSYFPASPRPTIARPATQRHSYPDQQTQARQQHTPYSHISSGVADHDAALRASLSTLLSCAAAARGLPKARTGMTTPARGPSARVDPASLRLVSESVALGETSLEPVFNPTIRRTSTTTSSGVDSLDKHPSKRKAATSTSNNTNAHGRGASKDRRAVKKARRSHSSGTDDANNTNSGVLSPTLLTWVVSAGVVVLVSALSFTAGFAVGREVGRSEVEFLGGGEMSGCAREIGRTGGLGFRRLKLGVGRAVRV